MKLKNKVAIVAGGARDIGRAVSVKLAAEGAKVVVNYYNNEDQAKETLAEMDNDFFEFVMKLNVSSTFMVTKAVVPLMGDGASIINFASQAGRDGGGPGASAYAASKGAIMTFTRAMAKELGPQNIRVNALCPGMIATTLHDTFTKDAVSMKRDFE